MDVINDLSQSKYITKTREGGSYPPSHPRLNCSTTFSNSHCVVVVVDDDSF